MKLVGDGFCESCKSYYNPFFKTMHKFPKPSRASGLSLTVRYVCSDCLEYMIQNEWELSETETNKDELEKPRRGCIKRIGGAVCTNEAKSHSNYCAKHLKQMEKW